MLDSKSIQKIYFHIISLRLFYFKYQFPDIFFVTLFLNKHRVLLSEAVTSSRFLNIKIPPF